MISLRYHIITIVALFLAIGLGLLVGTTVVQPGLVTSLEDRTQALRRDLSDLRGRVGDLETEVAQLERAGDILPVLDTGALQDVPVVVLTQEDVDGGLLQEVRSALDTAGARVLAILAATPRMGATEDGSREDLAAVLGLDPATDGETLSRRAAEALAQRLWERQGRGSSVDGDVLGELLDGNFLVASADSPTLSTADLPDIGGEDQIIVVLEGGDVDPALSPEVFSVPLVEALVRRGMQVGAAESASSVYPFVEVLRDGASGEDGTGLVTVDDADFSTGSAALALGLERLLLLSEGGHYGIKAGASAPIPDVP